MDLSTPTLFFSPNPRKESVVTEAGIDQASFHQYPQNDILVAVFGMRPEELRESSYKGGRFDFLVQTYLNYAESQDEKCEPSSHNIMNGGPERGQLGSICRGPKSASVVTAAGFTESCHRVLLMESSNDVEKNDDITVCELELLVSWMYGSMSAQLYALSRGGVRSSKYHMIFPVIAVSFLMPSHARVIQCYFDEGKLNVQSTPLYSFDVDRSEYSRLMDNFLKWVEPIPIGDTVLAEKFRKPTVATAQRTTPQSTSTGSMETAPSFGPPSVGLAVRSGNTGRQRSSKPTSQQVFRSGPAGRGSRSDENAPPSRDGR
ncbi:hypothetical protein CNMCM5793_004147 [Aspergillus hiratsukae]|uniref:Uncharacterized protein n=1 Tax=Aspergillus hiratsukae TaxID=1194566 RepID=A0A8H6P2M8_9EURO|nr:hypothetical protein CNMCM5793_004147 [Aspergillus hiratsukae]KAF7159106.1 hypothetical protein CNMCM6106_006191 [Aspergillus hiratsukae]